MKVALLRLKSRVESSGGAQVTEPSLIQLMFSIVGSSNVTVIPPVVETVARVYRSLPPEEQRQASIFTFNYGDAGAIEYFGRRYGLPGAIGGHNNYWLWGPSGHTGQVVLVVGDQREDVERSFVDVEAGAVIDCGLCMPYENNRTVWIARGIRTPIEEIWPRLKHFD